MECLSTVAKELEEEYSEDELFAMVEEMYNKLVGKLREKKYWQKLNEPKPVVKHSAAELLKIVIGRGNERISGFNLKPEELEIYKTLAMYFADDAAFESRGEDFSLKKGILLYGNIGCGKTTCIQLFTMNQKQVYRVDSCREVAYTFAKEGYEGLERWFKTVPITPTDKNFYQKELSFCFDDLGTENTTKNFGNTANAMAEVILNRYDQESRAGKFKTHITTNLPLVEPELPPNATIEQINNFNNIKDFNIEKYYGPRVVDRMVEMFNFIVFPENAASKRK